MLSSSEDLQLEVSVSPFSLACKHLAGSWDKGSKKAAFLVTSWKVLLIMLEIAQPITKA